jgi:hypothetical protein
MARALLIDSMSASRVLNQCSKKGTKMEKFEKKAPGSSIVLVSFEIMNPSESLVQDSALACGGPRDG